MIWAAFSSCCCCSCSCCSFCSKGSSRIGKRHALTAAAAAKLRNTWRHQPLLQYCLYLLLLLLAAVAVRLLWACSCRCYCRCRCSAAAPLERFPRPVVVFLVGVRGFVVVVVDGFCVHNLSALTRSPLRWPGSADFLSHGGLIWSTAWRFAKPWHQTSRCSSPTPVFIWLAAQSMLIKKYKNLARILWGISGEPLAVRVRTIFNQVSQYNICNYMYIYIFVLYAVNMIYIYIHTYIHRNIYIIFIITYIYICLSILSIYLSIYLSVCLSVCLSLSIHMYIHVYIYINT